MWEYFKNIFQKHQIAKQNDLSSPKSSSGFLGLSCRPLECLELPMRFDTGLDDIFDNGILGDYFCFLKIHKKIHSKYTDY